MLLTAGQAPLGLKGRQQAQKSVPMNDRLSDAASLTALASKTES